MYQPTDTICRGGQEQDCDFTATGTVEVTRGHSRLPSSAALPWRANWHTSPSHDAVWFSRKHGAVLNRPRAATPARHVRQSDQKAASHPR
jgi:hypothetical protein